MTDRTEVAYVYALAAPGSHEKKYIGISKNPSRRRKAHRSRHDYAQTRKEEWVNQLLSCGMTPVFTIIRCVPRTEARTIEKQLIGEYLRDGHRLLNMEHIYSRSTFQRTQDMQRIISTLRPRLLQFVGL